MLVLDPNDSDEKIVNKIVEYVNDDDKRNALIAKGLEVSKDYTQEEYAKRFIIRAEDYLDSLK